jgi:high-affinity iron transporter
MGSFVVVLREGFEAALVVGLILAFLNKTGHGAEHRKAVWTGVVAALGSSLVIGAILFAAVGELEGTAEKLFEGTAMLLAAAVVTWMVFWMRKQARTLGGNLRSQVSDAMLQGSAFALGTVAFIGVAREGLESALFLFASVGDDGLAASVIGGSAGAFLAVTLGFLFYKGTLKLDLRRFFMITGVLVILFAAYLIRGGLHEMGEAGAGEIFETLAPVAALLYGIGLTVFYLKSNPKAPPRQAETAEEATPPAPAPVA